MEEAKRTKKNSSFFFGRFGNFVAIRIYFQPLATMLIGIAVSCFAACSENRPGGGEWGEYLGGPDRNHFSSLDQIQPGNVHQLQLAWIFHTLDTGNMECNPIIADGILYGMTATSQPFAIDAATGELIWIEKGE